MRPRISQPQCNKSEASVGLSGNNDVNLAIDTIQAYASSAQSLSVDGRPYVNEVGAHRMLAATGLISRSGIIGPLVSDPSGREGRERNATR